MRWGPLTLRIGALAVELLVAAILVLSVLPLLSGGLDIDTSEGATAASLEDGVLTMAFPLEIYNGGYFDIEDVKVSISLDANGTVLTSASDVMDIRAGVVNRLDPSFSFDLNDIEADRLDALLFESSPMILGVNVEGRYAWGLIGADVSYQRTVDWEPLVSSLALSLDEPTWENGTTMSVLMHYGFDASSLLHGMEAGMVITVTGENGATGSASATLVLDQRNEGAIRMTVPVSMAMPQALVVDIGLSVGGMEAHIERVYRWEGMP